MPWGKVDDSFYDHPKLDRLPEKVRLPAIGLYWLCISWCNRFLTDGFVPNGRLSKLAGSAAIADRLTAPLVDAELFDEAPGGVNVHDYLTFNKSKEQVEKERRDAAERAAKSRRDSQRDFDGGAEPPSRPPRPPRPNTRPTPRSNGSQDQGEHDAAVARANAILQDPTASDDMKVAARFALERLAA